MSCGADIVANQILTSITAGENFNIPNFPTTGDNFDIPPSLLEAIEQTPSLMGVGALTTGTINGDGVFDGLMQSIKVHLMDEFKAGRIVGGEFTKAYTALVQVALGNATQFLLSRDQAYWSSINAQIAAINAKVALKTAVVQLSIAQIQAANQKAEFGLTKIRIANEDAAYCLNLKKLEVESFNLANILPAQLEQMTTQKDLTVAQTDLVGKQAIQATSQTAQIAQQTLLISEQVEVQRGQTRNTHSDGSAMTGLLGSQIEAANFNISTMLPAQLILLKEQAEVQRAQTHDNRIDGQLINGAVGKQKALYSQQMVSYQRSSEINAAKLFTDAWISHKAVDEGIDTPAAFNAASVSAVLTAVRSNNVI